MLDALARPVHVGLTRTTEPSVEPVTLDDAKGWLHVGDVHEDATIDSLIRAARQKVEDDTGLALITQTWTYDVDKRPTDNVLILPVGPVSSVTSVTSYSTADVGSTVSTDVYRVDTTSLPARIVLKESQSWPTDVRRQSAYRVVFVAGYGSAASSVPEPLRLAMRVLLHHWHAFRAPVSALPVRDVPLTYDALIAPYRLRVLW